MRVGAHLGVAALALAALPIAPASAADGDPSCTVQAASVAPGIRAGTAVARGIFVTYADSDTVLDGGTVVPPDLSSPLAQVAVDRTGLGQALGAPFYSPYSDAAGVLNAFAGTALPVDGLSGPSRAKVSGSPPQDSAVALPGPGAGGACVRLSNGPVAQAAARALNATPGAEARSGDVRAISGPSGAGDSSTGSVVLTDVTIGPLRLEQVILHALALADGGPGSGAADALVQGVTLNGTPLRFGPEGFSPAGLSAPDTAALAAAGVELLAGGSTRHSETATESQAEATGPVLRFTTPDKRVLTIVLGTVGVRADHDRS